MYVAQGGAAFLSERNSKLYIKHAFEHYVHPQVVAQMVDHPELLILGGAQREITLLFTDLKGFTEISESIEPAGVLQLLNRHFTETTQIILHHNGTIDKYIGDAVMAFWGAPLDDPQQAVHACRAALDLQQAMRAMRERAAADRSPPLHMRIGIHSGTAIVGNMGSSERFDYSAIGDAVNLAARLEGLNKLYGTEVLISAATAVQLPAEFALRRVDRVRVKGRNEVVELFTFCADAGLCAVSDEALTAYRDQRWDLAESLWRKLLQIWPDDMIATLYLRRIDEFRRTPPERWYGFADVQKM